MEQKKKKKNEEDKKSNRKKKLLLHNVFHQFDVKTVINMRAYMYL